MSESATNGLTYEQRGRFRRYCQLHRIWHPDVHRRLAHAIGESPRAEQAFVRELSAAGRRRPSKSFEEESMWQSSS